MICHANTKVDANLCQSLVGVATGVFHLGKNILTKHKRMQFLASLGFQIGVVR
jgi:hypothetical protein